MSDEDRLRNELALVSQEAAIYVVASVVGVTLGPAGVIAGAFLGPFAVHAAKRFRELTTEVSAAGLDADTIVERLDDDEVLSQLVAEVVRGTVESDSAAKRALLAHAAIHALTDDAAVDEEARFVRTAIEVDTFDIRCSLTSASERRPMHRGIVSPPSRLSRSLNGCQERHTWQQWQSRP